MVIIRKTPISKAENWKVASNVRGCKKMKDKELCMNAKWRDMAEGMNYEINIKPCYNHLQELGCEKISHRNIYFYDEEEYWKGNANLGFGRQVQKHTWRKSRKKSRMHQGEVAMNYRECQWENSIEANGTRHVLYKGGWGTVRIYHARRTYEDSWRKGKMTQALSH